MPLHLRHLLIRLLLLAVFFNTVIGMPAHQAEHLLHQQQQTTAAASALSSLSAEAADADAHASQEHGSEVHAACASCLAYAHVGIAPTCSAAAPAWGWQADLPRPSAAQPFVPDPGRWRFAARDPPHAVS